jgi:hypothetical protein
VEFCASAESRPLDRDVGRSPALDLARRGDMDTFGAPDPNGGGLYIPGPVRDMHCGSRDGRSWM